MTKNKNTFILASASPRRKDLLRQIGIEPDFILPADIDETPHKGELPRDLALRLACEKAHTIHTQTSEPCFVLAADTVVAVGRRILDKPEGKKEATKYLSLLSGRRHHVYGGMALMTPHGKLIKRVSDTVVQFKRLSEADIAAYIKTGEWNGIAGGYAIQGHAAAFVKSIHGSYSNVVGLCLYDTMKILEGVGYNHGHTD